MSDVLCIENTVNFINRYIPNFEPEIAIILGSGLGSFADFSGAIKIPYSDIPGFETPSIKGHKGQLVFAKIFDKNVVIMQGRFHYYEGISIQKVVFPIAVFKQLGVKKIIITNASGGINVSFSQGDFMLITDHINFMCTNPLIGHVNYNLGLQFPDMSNIYSKKLINIAQKSADMMGIELKHGVYAAMTGPSYETPAEVRMLKILGADAVGMSTVPEAIFANYCGIEVLGISCITNLAAGLSENNLSHTEVIETSDRIKDKFNSFLNCILKNI